MSSSDAWLWTIGLQEMNARMPYQINSKVIVVTDCSVNSVPFVVFSFHDIFFPIHVSWKPWWFFSSVCHSVVVPGFIMGGFFILTKPLFFYLLTKPLFCLFTPMVPGICSKLNTQLAVLYSDFKITKAQFEGFYWSLRYKWNNFWCF
jgi:hypothetical protein